MNSIIKIQTWRQVLEIVFNFLAGQALVSLPDAHKEMLGHMADEAQRWTELVREIKKLRNDESEITPEQVFELVKQGLFADHKIECRPLLTDEQRENMLVGALEGGSNYWYFLNDASDARYARFMKPGKPVVDAIWEAIKAGEAIPVFESETEEPLGIISLKSIEEGEQLMFKEYPRHFGDVISGNDDANTADVWFQLAVMKDVVYG